MIYVRDLLKLDTFKDFELVSGENGLDRGVSWPNVAQTVSIREWLVGGDVIIQVCSYCSIEKFKRAFYIYV